jgi:hypothetical protein
MAGPASLNKLAMPEIRCGLDKLQWGKVKEIISRDHCLQIIDKEMGCSSKKTGTSPNTIFTHRAFALGPAEDSWASRRYFSSREVESAGHIRTT